MALEIVKAGGKFLRPGGREGSWNVGPNTRDPDDYVASPFDFVVLPRSEVVNALDDLKHLRPDMTPMLFGSPHDAGILFERFGSDKTAPADWIAQARSFDLDQWLASRQSDHEEDQDPDEPFPDRGPWPDSATPSTQLSVQVVSLLPGQTPAAIIGLLPITDPTETAAELHFGGWNDCPNPEVHICIARRWHEKYGAVQVSNGHDAIEFRVAKPVTDRQEALDLAWLQYLYCSDGLPGTLEEAAAELVGSTVWHFWWD